MKIQLDTENKTITIEEDINLNDFMERINILLPGGLWREFTLKITKIKEWSDPIVVPSTTPNIPTYPNPWEMPQPWVLPGTTSPNNWPNIWYTYDTNYDNKTTQIGNEQLYNYNLIDGKYNIEVI